MDQNLQRLELHYALGRDVEMSKVPHLLGGCTYRPSFSLCLIREGGLLVQCTGVVSVASEWLP